MDITLLSHGMRYVGISELAGKKNHPLISWWISLCNFDLEAADEIPWCSAFVNGMAWDLRLPRSNSLAARSWLEVGETIADPIAGWDIVVLKRGLEPQPGPEVLHAPGHVGIFAGWSNGMLSVLAGNQSNKVSVSLFPCGAPARFSETPVKFLRLLAVLERIADALDRAYPKREPLKNKDGAAYPSLGITVADSEELAASEAREEAEAQSREEKLMKEYAEYVDWRERNVR